MGLSWDDVKNAAKGYVTGQVIDPTGLIGGVGGMIYNTVTDGDLMDKLNPKNYFGNEDSIDAAKDQVAATSDLYAQNKEANDKLIGDYFSQMQGLYGDSNQAYKDALAKYIGSDNFSYDKNVEDFYSPAAQRRIQVAKDAITQSQANAGNMFSSDYLKQLDAQSQAIASEEYDKAFQRMLGDEGLKLQEYNTNQNRMGNIAGMLGNDAGKYADAVGNYYQSMIDNSNAYINGIADLNTQGAQLELQRKSALQDLLHPFG